ncbi:MAG: ATP-binding protein [Bacteroidales bacterium]|jgi:two-component system NtrC family sensor kinase
MFGKFKYNDQIGGPSLRRRYLKFRSSIYSRVVLVIAILSVFLLVSNNLIFRSVNDGYINTVIHQNGSNIGSIVEGALYHSMLENNRSALQNTLDVINTMPGIDDVNMYDNEDNLAYSSFSEGKEGHIDPNCKGCHADIAAMFPRTEKSYRIINSKSECKMSQTDKNSRHLLIRSPILNEPSCYNTAACHAHNSGEAVLGSLFIKMPLADVDAAVKKSTTEFFVIAALITLFMASFLVLFTRKNIKNPLMAIIKASKAVATGDNSARLKVSPDQLDDIRMLSYAFNHMLDNLQTATTELQNWSKQLEYKVQKKSEELGEVQNELINIERIASLGKLSSSVAHEINNPLSGILVYTKLVHKKLITENIEPAKKESMLKHLKLIEDETKRCGDIVKGLLDFSRKDQDDFETRHLHEILKDTYQLMSHPINIANINFLTDFSAHSDLTWCSPNQIKQALVAILVNASEAVMENGEILFKTLNPDEDSIRIEISDNGSGISPEDIPHIFEPFFTTKRNGNGIGLGLSIVHGIIQSHNGKIDIQSEPGRGTTISITLPLITNQEA